MKTTPFKVGQRVYYTENGPSDIGDVKEVRKDYFRIGLFGFPNQYMVVWENKSETDWYDEHQLTRVSDLFC